MKEVIWKEIVKELRKVKGKFVIVLRNDNDEEFALVDKGNGVRVDKNNENFIPQKQFLEEIENFTSVPYSIEIEFWKTTTHDFKKPNYSSPSELLSFLRKEWKNNPSFR